MSDCNKVIKEARKVIAEVQSIHMLLKEIKPLYLGKESFIASLSAKIKIASLEEKKEIGSEIQFLAKEINKLIDDKLSELKEAEYLEKLINNKIDGTLTKERNPHGSIHPVTFVADQIVKIFEKYGFSLQLGPEIETFYNNFTVLNMDKDHPACQMHDTFFMEGNEDYLLRTHTTSVDIASLKKFGAPLKVVSFGKTFRNDSDKTHTPMFHQFELLQVGEGLHFGHLKTLLINFLSEFFQSDNIELRLRPSYFPFTEPSVEVDIRYSLQNNKLVPDKKGDKYMEILGCGLLHPNVLKNAGIDSEKYQGIAAGMGIERLAMLKYNIADLREFFKSDISWLLDKSFNSMLY